MILAEGLCELTERQLEFTRFVESSDFPWYYQPSTSPNFMFHGHTLMRRAVDFDLERIPQEGIKQSAVCDIAISIFQDFAARAEIEYSTIFRAALNSTQYTPLSPHGEIHVDHKFPHKNFLFYLNEFNSGGTYIYNENKTVNYHVDSQKYKGVIWDGSPHAQGWCIPGQRRIVLIITFN